jgi:hypothetical protein
VSAYAYGSGDRFLGQVRERDKELTVVQTENRFHVLISNLTHHKAWIRGELFNRVQRVVRRSFVCTNEDEDR